MKILTAAAVALFVAGCAHAPSPQVNVIPKSPAARHAEPCPCTQTPNQVVKRRWFSGFKVRLFH